MSVSLACIGITFCNFVVARVGAYACGSKSLEDLGRCCRDHGSYGSRPQCKNPLCKCLTKKTNSLMSDCDLLFLLPSSFFLLLPSSFRPSSFLPSSFFLVPPSFLLPSFLPSFLLPSFLPSFFLPSFLPSFLLRLLSLAQEDLVVDRIVVLWCCGGLSSTASLCSAAGDRLRFAQHCLRCDTTPHHAAQPGQRRVTTCPAAAAAASPPCCASAATAASSRAHWTVRCLHGLAWRGPL